MSKASDYIRAIEDMAHEKLTALAWEEVSKMPNTGADFEKIDEQFKHLSSRVRNLIKYFYAQVYNVPQEELVHDELKSWNQKK